MPEHKHMTVWHRTVSVITISLISFVGLESLVYIRNLYDPEIYRQSPIYIEASGLIYLILLFWLSFIFDLHFRNREPITATGLWHKFKNRFRHLVNWEHLRFFQNYLILPGLIYWGSIILIGINFGHVKLQQFIAVVSSLALVVAYTFFKEIFRRKTTPIDDNHFVILTYVKLYASWLVYAGALGIVWYYDFSPLMFYAVIFLVTMMLLYQALFQFGEVRPRNVGYIFAISLGLSLSSYFVYRFWNVNYFSAGLFMTAIYNFLWFMLYHGIKKTMNRQVVMEQLAILAVIIVMVLGVTNFKARIDR